MDAETHTRLVETTLKLVRYNQGPIDAESDTAIHVSGISSSILNRNPAIMRDWNKMIAELSSTASRDDACISLHFEMVCFETGGVVSSTLLEAFKGMHYPRLFIKYPVNHWLEFTSEALKLNSSVRLLAINGEYVLPVFKSKKNATSLVRAVISHSSLDNLVLDKCEIGRNTLIPAFIPVLNKIKFVQLRGSGIESYGATLIANSLASNPCVQYLSLEHNMLKDSDASKLAASLKTNTTLMMLQLTGNDITDVGAESLFDALHGNGNNFNDVYDSNHVCSIDLLSGRNPNKVTDTKQNMISKVLWAILRYRRHLDDVVPRKLLPRLLVLLQRGGTLNHSKIDPLDAVFQYVRREGHVVLQQYLSHGYGSSLICLEGTEKTFGSLHLSTEK